MELTNNTGVYFNWLIIQMNESSELIESQIEYKP
jgi:hypothetical protein